MSPNPTLCGICSARPQKYNCPRCNVAYCSVDCYKAPTHHQCSETFYRDNVIEEMAGLSRRLPGGILYADGGPSIRATVGAQNMMNILGRLQEENRVELDINDYEPKSEPSELDSDDEEVIDVMERLADVNMDDPNAVWNALDVVERAHFEQILACDEKLSELIPYNPPWWIPDLPVLPKLIEEIGTDEEAKIHEDDEAKLQWPQLANSAAPQPSIRRRLITTPFSKLTTQRPHRSTLANMSNVIAAYVLTYRVFNGDLRSLPAEAATHLVRASGCLRHREQFATYGEAAAAACGPEANELARDLVRRDVRRIMFGPKGDARSSRWILAALSDVWQLLRAGRREAEAVEKKKRTKVTGGDGGKTEAAVTVASQTKDGDDGDGQEKTDQKKKDPADVESSKTEAEASGVDAASDEQAATEQSSGQKLGEFDKRFPTAVHFDAELLKRVTVSHYCRKIEYYMSYCSDRTLMGYDRWDKKDKDDTKSKKVIRK